MYFYLPSTYVYVKYYNLAVHMRTLVQFRRILDKGEIESVHRVVKAIKTSRAILMNPQPHHQVPYAHSVLGVYLNMNIPSDDQLGLNIPLYR